MSDIVEGFSALVGPEVEDERIDLLRAALWIARTEYPALDEAVYVSRVDDLATRVSAKLKAPEDTVATLCAINEVLFEEEGFRGNSDEYYDPRNSFINDVLDRKLGIPITLSLVYMEVARRVGVALFGVGMPGHFLLKHFEPDGREYFLDPYGGGQLMSVEDCQLKIQQIYGSELSPEVVTQAEYLGTVRKRQMLTRMLNNLRNIYMTRRTLKKALEILDLVLTIHPISTEDLKQRALLRYQLGMAYAAVQDLERYALIVPEAPDAEEMKETALSIRRSIAMMN